MKKYIAKMDMVANKLGPRMRYFLDRILAKNGMLGEKLQTAPIMFNIALDQDPIRAIEENGQRVQRGRNTFIPLLFSWQTNVIRSPDQIIETILRHLYHMSKVAYLTIPASKNKDGKKKKKAERQILVDLCDLLAVFGIHDNTDNIHVHGGLSPIHPVYGVNVRINGGYYQYACAYAREQVLLEYGLIKEDDLLYIIRTDALGRNRVEIDEAVLAIRAVRDKALAETIMRAQHGGEVESGNVVEVKSTEPLYVMPSMRWRNCRHIGEDFQKFCEVLYPDGPAPFPNNNVSPVERQQKLDLETLNTILINNNCGIKTEKDGPLALIKNREQVSMDFVDKRWTKATVEKLTGLSGEWVVGLPKEKQTVIPRIHAFTEQLLNRFSAMSAEVINGKRKSHTKAEFQLPWTEYRVLERHFRGNKDMRLSREDLSKLADDYLACAVSRKISIDKPAPGERQLANFYVSPSLPDGLLTITIYDIPAANLEKTLQLNPNIVLREARVDDPAKRNAGDPAKFYSAVFTVQYHVEERWQARNALKRVARKVARFLEASGYTTAFKMPDVPWMITSMITFPSIAFVPNKAISEPLQAMLAPAWEELVAEERSEMIAKIKQTAKYADVNPTKAISALAETTPARAPLTVMGKNSEVALILANMLTATAKQKPIVEVENETVEQPPQQQMQAICDEVFERLRREREEERNKKNAKGR